MKILEYTGLDVSRCKSQYKKLVGFIEKDDFQSADVKKLSNIGHGRFYRARLDYANRLLFSVIRHGDNVYALMLEVIENHAYEKSRFLRGATIDDDKIPAADPGELSEAAEPVRYVHPERREIHLLDKVISFDDVQETVYREPPPLIVVGSAGSGKTALTLEKMKQVTGDVLYVTHSAYLAQSARDLYYANGFENENQEAVFLSYREFVETLHIPAGREASWRDFSGWFGRMRQQFRGIEAHQAFEEIRGVIAADAAGVLSREDYRQLGIRQSIFAVDSRDGLYDLFEKYREWLGSAGLFDLNLVAHGLMDRATPRHDFVVIDEVQDLTTVQLALILKTLRKPDHFLLCGDSNQIVHPNFFSWSKVKSLFWQDPALADHQQLRVLRANFRNGSETTRVANTLLKIKHRRFGSIDRESNFLVEAMAGDSGTVTVLADRDAVKKDLNQKTRASTAFAVLVMRDEDKSEARRHFQTPLVFAIHEAKGLEYDNIILYRFISDHRQPFSEIAEGVSAADLLEDSLEYRRARDKQDKSLEIFKFYVNALYVALTRAVRNVYLVESDTGHPLLSLLTLRPGTDRVEVAAQQSSLEDWQREARKLELQGKQEQADAIRQNILKEEPVPWPVFDETRLRETLARVFIDKVPGSKLKRQLYEYACAYDEPRLAAHLANMAGFDQAKSFEGHQATLGYKHLVQYCGKNFRKLLRQCDKYGIDHRNTTNLTPLMAATIVGNVDLIDALLERGANPELTDHLGRNALHWAILEAARKPKYAEGAFAAIYQRIAPSSIDFKVGDRLIRIDRHLSEYLLIQTLWALMKQRSCRIGVRFAFDTQTVMEAWEHFPAQVLRAERKKRHHITHLLSRNEVQRDYAYNRYLFFRVTTGFYHFNPTLSVRQRGAEGEESWVPLFKALNLPLIRELAAPINWKFATELMVKGGVASADNPLLQAPYANWQAEQEALRQVPKPQQPPASPDSVRQSYLKALEQYARQNNATKTGKK